MTHRDPADLRPHSILHHIPAPAKDAPEVCACADTIRDQDGHLLPLVIDEAGHLLTDDSRLRWMAAKRMGLTEVPVIIQPAALAPVIALNALVHRAHLTMGARAFIAVEMLKPAFEAARAFRLEFIKKGQKSPLVHSVDERAKSVEELAEKMGVGRTLLFQAKQVHEKFAADKKKYLFKVQGGERDGEEVELTLRDYFLPLIMRSQSGGEHESTRPMGLGAVIAGIAGVQNTKGVVKHTGTQLDLFVGSFVSGAKRLAYWNDLGPADRSVALARVIDWVEVMPDDLQEELFAALKAKRKQNRE